MIIPGYEYLACIQNNPPTMLRRLPTLADCPKLKGSAINLDLRMLSREFVDKLTPYHNHYEQAVEKHLCVHPTHTLAASLRRLMNQSMCKLVRISLTYPEIQLAVVEFQRTALSIDTFLLYTSMFWPRIHQSKDTIHEVDASLMGGFTEDLTIADDFHRAGIPIWVLQPEFRITSQTRFRKQVPFTRPSAITDDAKPPFKTVHSGPFGPDFVHWLQRMNQRLLDIIQRPSFIETPQTLDSTAPTTSSAGPIRHAPSSSSSAPYASSSSVSTHPSSSFRRPKTRNKPETPPISPGTKYITPEGAAFPPMLALWKAAILAIETASTDKPQGRHHIGYCVPDQRIFHDDKHRAAYAATWLACRVAHLGNVVEQKTGIINKEQWRLFLNGVRQRLPLPLPDVAATSSHKPPHYLDGMTNLLRDIGEVVWFDQQFKLTSQQGATSIPGDVIAEVVWELMELGFRFELAHIDRCLAPTQWEGEDSNREDQIFNVFAREPDGAVGGFTLAAFPTKNCGLASSDICECARATFALQEVVKSWPGCPSEITSAPFSESSYHVDDLTTKISHYYCQTFFECFGRPPVVPHGLPLHSLEKYVPRWFADSVATSA
ncbi:hypothetical protein BKA70DRAFT_1452950 [Coprinopsis sp. MPI-PUGE-AT-0042]|nr:hypothetical protein BKA70DRAFT_1452950 [Coprinopsis sp. MPI-PUGE-AT-0042]